MNKQQCDATGCIFYRPPAELVKEEVDPLIWAAVRDINDSGWVWTAESCQGHPDATGSGTWANNTKPMLRLVTKSENFGEMLDCLMRSLALPIREVDGWLCPETILSCELYPYRFEEYCELLVYIPARTAYDRNMGILAFENFARLINTIRK